MGSDLSPGDADRHSVAEFDRYLECLFGLSLGGFVFVPINTRLAPPEIVFWLADSGCSALMIDDTFAPVLPKVLPETPDLKHVVYIGEGAAPAGVAGLRDAARGCHAVRRLNWIEQRSGGNFLYRRDDGPVEGRDVEP